MWYSNHEVNALACELYANGDAPKMRTCVRMAEDRLPELERYAAEWDAAAALQARSVGHDGDDDDAQ